MGEIGYLFLGLHFIDTQKNHMSLDYFVASACYIFDFVNKDIKRNLGVFLGNYVVLFQNVFYFLIFRNYFGLLPYVFSFTSHLRLIIRFRFVFWVALFIISILYNFKNFIIHLVPEGSSFVLMPLMVLIERLRNIIRPFTLSIRLSANIIAGHLLIVLVNDFCKSLPLDQIFICGFGSVALSILESAVIAIQAYVFVILLTLYYSDLT